MQPDSLSFLKRLLDAPGPSGSETRPARLWRAEAERFADRVSADVGGNSLATLNPDGRPRLMFAGHIDEIGVMVSYIDDDGFCHFETIGGWDTQVFVGQRVVLLGRDALVPGVVGKRAIHLMEKEEREKVSRAEDLWIDVGARSRDEVLALGLRIGDSGVLGSTVQEFANGRIVSRSLDNRMGAFVVLEALRLLAQDRPEGMVTAVATTQEEIAWQTGGGARTTAVTLEAEVAIVVDVTHATDYPGMQKHRHGDVKLGGGPVLSRGSAVNPVVLELLVEAAEAEGIPYTLQAAPKHTGTDADSIYTAHRGVATGLVSVPNRYMHSPSEMVDLGDLERAAQLLAAFARRVTTKTDFVPR
ncbi:MAG TPA: M42 family metallopeptidase [Gemmatimonadales bacterium]|nr:M42 family metallopeptidase [Gemmatimonadales bacterium]